MRVSPPPLFLSYPLSGFFCCQFSVHLIFVCCSCPLSLTLLSLPPFCRFVLHLAAPQQFFVAYFCASLFISGLVAPCCAAEIFSLPAFVRRFLFRPSARIVMKFFSVLSDDKEKNKIYTQRVVIKIANKWQKKSNIATQKISFQRNLPVIVWKTSASLAIGVSAVYMCMCMCRNVLGYIFCRVCPICLF